MNIWTGLLFLEGAVADAGLARELVGGSDRIEAPASAPGTAEVPPPPGLTLTEPRAAGATH